MKRLIALAVAGMMAVLLVGCGEHAPKQDTKPETTMDATEQKPAATTTEESTDTTTEAPATDSSN